MKIIVVEGPDNAGKTTLGLQLAKKLRAAFIKVERPASGLDLMQFQHIIEFAGTYSGCVVADRHPCISEPIYGSIIRGGHFLTQDDILLCYRCITAIVYCRPPVEMILKTIYDRPQMEGVIEKARDIIKAYDSLMVESPPHQFPRTIGYDYTHPACNVDSLIKELKL